MAILSPVLRPEELSGVGGVVVDGLGGPLGWAGVLELGAGEPEGLGLALVLSVSRLFLFSLSRLSLLSLSRSLFMLLSSVIPFVGVGVGGGVVGAVVEGLEG